MFNLTLKSPLDANPQPPPSPNTPSTNSPSIPPAIPVAASSNQTPVAVENPNDYTTPLNSSAPNATESVMAMPPPAPSEPDDVEKTLEEIAASLTPPPSVAISSSQTSNPIPNTPPSAQASSTATSTPPAPTPGDQPSNTATDPVRALAQLMAEREIISQKQIDDVVAHLSASELKNIAGRVGETAISKIPLDYNGQTIYINLSDVLAFVAGKINSINVSS